MEGYKQRLWAMTEVGEEQEGILMNNCCILIPPIPGPWGHNTTPKNRPLLSLHPFLSLHPVFAPLWLLFSSRLPRPWVSNSGLGIASRKERWFVCRIFCSLFSLLCLFDWLRWIFSTPHASVRLSWEIWLWLCRTVQKLCKLCQQNVKIPIFNLSYCPAFYYFSVEQILHKYTYIPASS